MDLTRKQFDILVAMAESKTALTQRELEKLTGHSLGTVNRVFKELTEAGYVAEGAITNDGINALEPYRCKRAVFIAAGFGTRLVPITFNTPKPLVRVHGVRIIDRLIDACLEAGINEIYIVRGYLSELFDQLLYKYPMIKFLENPVYNEANNISSSLVARYMLSNAYVTHDQEEAFALSDRIMVLNDLRIAQLDTPYNLYHHPADPFVKRFIVDHLDLKVKSISDSIAGPEESGAEGRA